MKKGSTGEASLHVRASAQQLFDMVSDVTRMGEWSPETIRGEWIGGATRPEVGARFKGTNRRGVMRWSTRPEVVAADQSREFSFVTKRRGFPSTKWSFRFEQAGDGNTELVESFELLDDYSLLGGFIVRRFVWKTDDRRADLEAGMLRTLERIKAVAEGS